VAATTQGSGATVRLSARLDAAEITLPATVLPADTLPGRVVLTDWSKSGGRWTHALPIKVEKSFNKKARPPKGAALMDGKRQTERNRDWKWSGLDVVLMSDPEGRELALVDPALAKKQVRLDPDSAGMEPVDFVQHQVTHKSMVDGAITRTGLMLPAPGAITWRVEVPADATLETALTMVPNGLDDHGSDGAVVHVEIDGERLTSWPVQAGRSFDEHTLDLSKHAGQTVELTLRTDPGKDASWDTVFLADPLIVGAPLAPVRRVIIIGVDTLRYDALTQQGATRDVSVALDPFAESTLLFDSAYAPAPRTRPSFRSATTGLYPVPAIDGTSIGTVLRDNGFVCGGVTANVHLVPRFDFNAGFDFWQFENAEDADTQIGRAQSFLSANEDRDTFLFLHLMDPHNFYKAPGLYRNRYVEHEQGEMSADYNRWKILSMDDQFTDENHAWLRDRYDGEVAYMSDQLADFLAWVLALDGETLIIIHSDHGEEFWEHGSYEHNHTLYDEVVKANLWIRPPSGWSGGPHRVDQPVSLIDIAPTVYDMVGVPRDDWPELDGTSLRALMDAEQDPSPLETQLAARPLQIGHLMYDRELMGVVVDGHKYILRTWDGHQELYDLAADPGELNDLIDSTSSERIDEFLTALGQAHRSPAGSGWRVKVERANQPFTLTFDQPVDAQVMDPEAGNRRRANIEWGDLPDHTKPDVGVLDFNEDRTSVTFTPGDVARGTLLITVPEGATAVLWIGDQQLEVDAAGGSFRESGVQLRVTPGPVLLVQDRVADRVGTFEERDAETEAALMGLGYIEED
jgi:arylsulfatase A-like enzyme